jgi:hypothetical protein
MTSSTRISGARHFTNRAQRSQSVAAQPSVPPQGKTAPRSPRQGPGNDARETPANPTTTKEPPKPPRTERIQLVIDSIKNYDLIKPIPVLIESLGDTVFVAEAPDLNLSITGNSIGTALLLLKDHIINIYEGYRGKKALDPERARQLTIFDDYIVKSRRHWF